MIFISAIFFQTGLTISLNTTKVNSEFISILFLPFGGGMLQSKNNQRIKYNTLNILCHYAAEDDFCNDQWQCK
jgi:hypothetical protein